MGVIPAHHFTSASPRASQSDTVYYFTSVNCFLTVVSRTVGQLLLAIWRLESGSGVEKLSTRDSSRGDVKIVLVGLGAPVRLTHGH